MKKSLVILIAAVVIFSASPKQAYAANMVSEMAVNKGGQSVAECARTMEKGISECVKALECEK